METPPRGGTRRRVDMEASGGDVRRDGCGGWRWDVCGIGGGGGGAGVEAEMADLRWRWARRWRWRSSVVGGDGGGGGGSAVVAVIGGLSGVSLGRVVLSHVLYSAGG